MQKNKFLFGIVTVDIVCLAIQYVLGMFVNLYVQFPGTLPHNDAWAWVFSHSGVTTAHIILGSIVVLLSIVALCFSIATRKASVMTLSILGFLMVAFAWLSGARFLGNVAQNAPSFMMAIGFIGSIVFYGWQLFALYRYNRSTN